MRGSQSSISLRLVFLNVTNDIRIQAYHFSLICQMINSNTQQSAMNAVFYKAILSSNLFDEQLIFPIHLYIFRMNIQFLVEIRFLCSNHEITDIHMKNIVITLLIFNSYLLFSNVTASLWPSSSESTPSVQASTQQGH